MSAAESFGENRNSFVFPLTKMSLKLICNTKIPKHCWNICQKPTLFSTNLLLKCCLFWVSYHNGAKAECKVTKTKPHIWLLVDPRGICDCRALQTAQQIYREFKRLSFTKASGLCFYLLKLLDNTQCQFCTQNPWKYKVRLHILSGSYNKILAYLTPQTRQEQFS